MDSVEGLRKVAQALQELRAKKALFEKAARELEKHIELCETSLYDELTDAGLEKQHYPGLGTFTANLTPRASIIPGDESFYGYLESRGDERIIKKTIHHATLTSYVTKELPEDTDLNSIGISLYHKKSISIRKDK